MMDVSVVIVNYNQFELLQNCIKSIIEFHNNIEYEIIVVDNNSQEGNVLDYVPDHPSVKIIQNDTNLGFSKANNIGLKEATGKYTLILNNDTLFHENTIEILLNHIGKGNKPAIIGCRLLNEDGSNQVSIGEFDTLMNILTTSLFLYLLFPSSKYFNRYWQNYTEISDPVTVDYVKGAFMFASTKALKEINGFDETFYFYGEEADLCRRFTENGGAVIFYPGTSIYHLDGATTIRNLEFKFKNQSIAKIIACKKQFSGVKSFLALLFYFTGIVIRIPVYFFLGIIKLDKFTLLKSYYFMRMLFWR